MKKFFAWFQVNFVTRVLFASFYACAFLIKKLYGKYRHFLLFCILPVTFSFFLITGCASHTVAKQISHPALHDITAIQTSGMKVTVQKFGENNVNRLLLDLAKLKPLTKQESTGIHRGNRPVKDYTTLVFYYGKHQIQPLFLFEYHKQWYAQTKDGMIYKNVEAFNNVIDYTSTTQNSSQSTSFFGPSSGSGTFTYDIPSKKLVLFAKQLNELDLRYYFASYADGYLTSGVSKDVAIKNAKDSLLASECEYQYALHNHLIATPSQIKEYTIPDSDISNLSEMKAAFTSAGYSYQAHLKKAKSSYFYNHDYTTQALYDHIFKDFYDGVSDHVGKKECNSASEYWNAYLTDVILPLSDSSYLATFRQELNSAEQYYKTH